MVSVKVQVLDGADLSAELSKLDGKVEAFLNEKEKRIREAKK